MKPENAIAIIDFGSQYSQLIARRVREHQVYSELVPWNASPDRLKTLNPRGYILSGGPDSIYEEQAPQIPTHVLESGKPILGICYGMQALTQALGGRVAASSEREYGLTHLSISQINPLISPGQHPVWMSHGDRIESLPAGFSTLGTTDSSPFAAMGDEERSYYGVQFHPEVHHTPIGAEILRRFAVGICGAKPTWTPDSIISESVTRIQSQVGKARVLSAVSGGVDSSVATTLVHRAVGNQLVGVFVNNGLLRKNEPEIVVKTFREALGVQLFPVNAVEDFMDALAGIAEPEQKRIIIGEKFIRIFEAQARRLGQPKFLVQGTIYPDVVESSGPDRSQAQRIKSHHNVGGLPEDMNFELVEPLRFLFKDEVRAVGQALGLPEDLVWRQPFPGPGLAVRCLGEITWERLERLREADAILQDELKQAGLLRMEPVTGSISGSAQAFAVLLPIRSVGVMGDKRTYQEVVALRAVTTDDFMTADWARLPHDLLAKIANRIVNEVNGINRVVYDITSKPPATIEWE
jgi:GMP synthase (glutamine-hydrolysing)